MANQNTPVNETSDSASSPGIGNYVHSLSRNQNKTPPKPKSLLCLEDDDIVAMAKKHGIPRVTKEAKERIRQFAMMTMEGMIQEAKIFAHSRVGYPKPNGKDNEAIVIKRDDFIAALKARGIIEYS